MRNLLILLLFALSHAYNPLWKCTCYDYYLNELLKKVPVDSQKPTPGPTADAKIRLPSFLDPSNGG